MSVPGRKERLGLGHIVLLQNDFFFQTDSRSRKSQVSKFPGSQNRLANYSFCVYHKRAKQIISGQNLSSGVLSYGISNKCLRIAVFCSVALNAFSEALPGCRATGDCNHPCSAAGLAIDRDWHEKNQKCRTVCRRQ